MGLFGKIKDIFYDPIEEEEEVKPTVKEEVKPRIEEVHFREEKNANVINNNVNPIKESVPLQSEREIFKTEAPSFKFPILDEDDEFEPIKTRVRPNALEEMKKKEAESKHNNRFELKKEEKTMEQPKERAFKPSPVISPVYGVLDKNYTKEEIRERQESNNIRINPNDKSIDSVRRKAYGTLEDELESTLTRINKEQESVDKVLEDIDNLNTNDNNKSIEALLNEIELNKNMSIGEAEEKMKDRYEEEEEIEIPKRFVSEKKEVEPEDDSFDKTLEHDLFNLIDSMYEDKKGE